MRTHGIKCFLTSEEFEIIQAAAGSSSPRIRGEYCRRLVLGDMDDGSNPAACLNEWDQRLNESRQRLEEDIEVAQKQCATPRALACRLRQILLTYECLFAGVLRRCSGQRNAGDGPKD